MQADNKRIAKNTAFLYLRMLFVLFVSLYTTRIVLQVLGVEDYGVYNVVGGFVSMFGFLNTSLTGAIQRFYNFEASKNGDEGAKKVYITSLIIQAFLAIVVLIALESFGIWYINNVMVIPDGRITAAHWLFQFSVLSLVLIIMQIPYSAAVMSFERMDFYAVMGILDVLLRLAIVIVLPYLLYDKLITYGLLVCLVSIINFVVYFIYVKKHFPFLQYQKHCDKSLFRPMLSFSGWNVLGTFAGVLKGQGLNMLLNAFFGPVVNAARGISFQIMAALQQFSVNIVVAFRPQLVSSYAVGDMKRAKDIMYSETKICYSLMCLFIAPLIIEIDYVLHLWLGDVVPSYTSAFSIIVLIIMIVGTLNTPLTQIIHASGKLKVYMIVTSMVTCSIIPLSWIALKNNSGPVSVFVVSLVITVINQIISMYLVKSVFLYKIFDYLKSVIAPCVLLSILMPIIPFGISFMMDQSLARLVTVCISAIISWILVFYFIVLNTNEKLLVKGYINKVLRKNDKVYRY